MREGESVNEVLAELKAGIRKFRTETYPKNKATYLQSVKEPQRPHALFITCADSRLDPELITQSGPGDIFVTRNIGNLVPAYGEMLGGVSAVVEYAVTGLKVQHVVICGHSDCGAMKGILEHDHLDELPMVKSWLQHAGPSSRWLRDALQDASSWSFEKKLGLLTEANVIMQMQNLRLHPAVAEGLKSGTVQVHAWMYDIGSGKLRRFDSEQGSFRSLIADGAPTTTQAQPERKIA